MTNGIQKYMERKDLYTFVENLALSGNKYFKISDIKNNLNLSDERIFEQVTDLFQWGVIDLKYVIPGEEEVYDSLNDVPKQMKINGEKITIKERDIFVRFYFTKEFLTMLNERANRNYELVE